ncbi:major head protein [Bacillus phage BC-7]|nr:major head protein [Bacillus phage BC-7]
MSIKIKPQDNGMFWQNNGANIPNVTDTQDVAPIIPQVIAGKIEKKLIDLIKFTPLAHVDSNLQGQAGMSVSFPTWNYIGDAKFYDEGADVDREQITAATKSFVVKKIAKDIQLTDESVIGTGGAVLNEVDGQLGLSIAQTIDKDVLARLQESKASAGGATDPVKIPTKKIVISQAGLAQLRVAFGEDIENTAILISPADYGKLLSMPEFIHVANGQAFMSGHVGSVMGLNVVITNRLKEKEAYLVRMGGLGIAVKRQVNVETERLMKARSSVVGADVHFVTYVRDASKLIAVDFEDAPAPPVGE